MSGQDPLLWRPPHRYVPGQTARHDEALFDAFKDANDSTPTEALAESVAFRLGGVFLHEGYFWEAHEMLEPVWMACPPNSAERIFVQALVQLANAGLKTCMGRSAAAERLYAECDLLFREAFQRAQGPIMGESQDALRERGEQVRMLSKKISAI